MALAAVINPTDSFKAWRLSYNSLVVDYISQSVTGPQTMISDLITSGDYTGARLKIGSGHTLTGGSSSIAGGSNNSATGDEGSAIGGGTDNVVSADSTIIGGGSGSTASGNLSAILGGLGNLTPGQYGAIGGGNSNLDVRLNLILPHVLGKALGTKAVVKSEVFLPGFARNHSFHVNTF